MLYIGIATLNHCDFLRKLRLCVSELTIFLIIVTVAHNCGFMSHICDFISYNVYLLNCNFLSHIYRNFVLRIVTIFHITE